MRFLSLGMLIMLGLFGMVVSLPVAHLHAQNSDVPKPLFQTAFTLRSSAVMDGGQLPKEYTGDGASATLPLEWGGAPTGTTRYAVIMHHIDRESKTKCYWILFNIPGDVTNLPQNVTGVGVLGNNSITGAIGYAPPHSKGPGPKTYVYTVYALSSPAQVDGISSNVTRDVLLAAMHDHILDTAELHVVYTRFTMPL